MEVGRLPDCAVRMRDSRVFSRCRGRCGFAGHRPTLQAIGWGAASSEGEKCLRPMNGGICTSNVSPEIRSFFLVGSTPAYWSYKGTLSRAGLLYFKSTFFLSGVRPAYCIRGSCHVQG